MGQHSVPLTFECRLDNPLIRWRPSPQALGCPYPGVIEPRRVMRSLDDVVVHKDLQYRSTDRDSLRLDLYVPEGIPAASVVVYAHGGAWLMGERTDFAERFVALAQE